MLDTLQHALGGYREYRVPDDLREVAAAIWCYSRPEHAPPIPGRGHRVLPDTGVSLCFWSRRDARGRVADAQVVVIGPSPTIHFFAPVPGEHLESIRLKPEWSRDLLGIDPSEYRDGQCEWDGAQGLRDSLARTRTAAEALAMLAGELRARRVRSRIERATVVSHDALEQVRRGAIALQTLPRLVRVSERQLRRDIIMTTGLTAKHAQRIMRVNRAVVSADRVEDPDWAAIALDAGFYDQSHMIAEFRDIAGATASVLHAERRMQQG